jgi:DNA-binding NarL/FixJ family response regulator
MIKLAIGCSNYLFAEGLKSLLEGDNEIEVVGIFVRDGGTVPGLKETLDLKPDVILLDFISNFNIILGLPENVLINSNLKVLLIGDRSLDNISDSDIKELIAKGIVGIIPPSADSNLFKKALKAVSSGDFWLDRTMLIKLFSTMKQQGKSVTLAKREKEIVVHLCQGYRNKEIAQKLNISEQTVKSHCNRIYKKLGVTDRLQLALYSFNIWPAHTKV